MSSLWAKIAQGIDLATSKDIPDVGEFWIDPKTNNGKIGDGKTAMFELPWISLSVDLSTEPSKKYTMPHHVKRFIEANIDVIERYDLDTMYNRIATDQFKRDVTVALLEAGIDVKEHLKYIPVCIEDLILDPSDWSIPFKDAQSAPYMPYTKSEIDTKIHEVTEEFTKQMCRSLGIPAHFMTRKIGE